MKNKPDTKLEEGLKSKLGNLITESSIEFDHTVVEIASKDVTDFFSVLKLDADLRFEILLDVTATDWLDSRAARFEVVYHLLSLTHKHRLRVKCAVSEDAPVIQSICDLWSSANFLEREVWDMYGITFKDHPDLRRILMYDEFEGHPLRKDYPVQGKQPRIEMISPEVHNTARDMQRAPLVKINRRKSTESGSAGGSGARR